MAIEEEWCEVQTDAITLLTSLLAAHEEGDDANWWDHNYKHLCEIIYLSKYRLQEEGFKMRLAWFGKKKSQRLSAASEAISELLKMPAEQWAEEFLLKYGKFSLNQAWQLSKKVELGSALDWRERLLLMVCLMREHSRSIDSRCKSGHNRVEIFKDDNEYYEVPKRTQGEEEVATRGVNSGNSAKGSDDGSTGSGEFNSWAQAESSMAGRQFAVDACSSAQALNKDELVNILLVLQRDAWRAAKAGVEGE